MFLGSKINYEIRTDTRGVAKVVPLIVPEIDHKFVLQVGSIAREAMPGQL